MRRRLVRSTAVCLALAALAAPTALADPTDLRTLDAIDAAAAVERTQDLRTVDARDAAEGRGTYTAPNVVILKVPKPVPADDGIDWVDAGFGAGGLLALMLLGLGGSLAVVHRRQSHKTSGV
jgi:hypothetical protein